MTPDEIMAKASHIFENVEDINTMGEARQAVRDAASMLFYLAKHIKRISADVALIPLTPANSNGEHK
jgi:hypothetical protein